MTIITLPYLYRVRGIIKGQRTTKTHLLRGSVLVDAPDLSSKETPVALEIPNTTERYHVIYRAVNERPVRRMQQPGYGLYGYTEGPMTAERLAAWVDIIENGNRDLSWKHYPLPYAREYHGELSRNIVDPSAFRSINQDFEEQDKAKAFNIASRMVFIDGELYIPTIEPRLLVKFHDSGERKCTASESIMPAIDAEVFRFDRKDDMLAFVRETSLPRQTFRFENSVIYHGGLTFQHDDASESALNTVNEVMLSLSQMGAQIRFMDESFFPWMCEMRERWRRSADRSEIVPVLEGLRNSLDACDDPACEQLVKSIRRTLHRPLIRQERYENNALPKHAIDNLQSFTLNP